MPTKVTKSTVSFDVDPLHHGELLEFIASFREEERSEAIIATLYIGMQTEHSPPEGNSEQLDEIKQEVAVVHKKMNDVYRLLEEIKKSGIAIASDASDDKTYTIDNEIAGNLDQWFPNDDEE